MRLAEAKPSRVWLVPLAILVATGLAFWALPLAWQDQPVAVTFEEAGR